MPPRPLLYLSTAVRLGVTNVARVIAYRLCLRAGVYRRWLPKEPAGALGLKLEASEPAEAAPWPDQGVLAEADRLLQGQADFFSVHRYAVGSPPDWLMNPALGARHPQATAHWSEISDFDPAAGDIKLVWEMSRFDWAPTFARAWRVTGDSRYLAALATWIEDWWQKNPPNTGPNWKCGQETSIRLINTLLALRVSGAKAQGLQPFVEAHCRRIAATTSYAIAQDNNHGSSEAAALFIGGLWLFAHGGASGRPWAANGRALLENRVARLVATDGSFSQHSLTYHRLLLDTLSVAEIFRRERGEAPFSAVLVRRAAAAARWLAAMIDPASGDGPNLGANDGAHPYRLDSCCYRDFRPSAQLSSILFAGQPALAPGPYDEPAAWLGVEIGAAEPQSARYASFNEGGYAVLRDGVGATVVVRAPIARFRPAHADALHVDLWWKGVNLLRDGGSYSYSDRGAMDALAGVAGHNTVQFDGHDQMPRLGRFLYAAWVDVDADAVIADGRYGQRWSGHYHDAWGSKHARTITLSGRQLTIRDEVHGFRDAAILRWRLAPSQWLLDGQVCSSPLGQLRVESDVPVRRVSLLPGVESRHYLERTLLPVLEVEISRSPGTLTTTIDMS